MCPIAGLVLCPSLRVRHEWRRGGARVPTQRSGGHGATVPATAHSSARVSARPRDIKNTLGVMKIWAVRLIIAAPRLLWSGALEQAANRLAHQGATPRMVKG